MKASNFLNALLVVNIVFSFCALLVKANCVSDLETQQLRHHSNLSVKQVERLVELANKGKPVKGWKLLGDFGDPYAAVAAKVLSAKKSVMGSFYNNLITRHWIQATGLEKYKKNFQSVAQQHFRQYVEIIRATGNWPDSDQILMSYFKAVRDHGLADITVFDAAWDAAGMNKYRSWQKLNHIEAERTVYPTNVCFQINQKEARRIIKQDLIYAWSPW